MKKQIEIFQLAWISGIIKILHDAVAEDASEGWKLKSTKSISSMHPIEIHISMEHESGSNCTFALFYSVDSKQNHMEPLNYTDPDGNVLTGTFTGVDAKLMFGAHALVFRAGLDSVEKIRDGKVEMVKIP